VGLIDILGVTSTQYSSRSQEYGKVPNFSSSNDDNLYGTAPVANETAYGESSFSALE
jgi:hypothetical protein